MVMVMVTVMMVWKKWGDVKRKKKRKEKHEINRKNRRKI